MSPSENTPPPARPPRRPAAPGRHAGAPGPAAPPRPAAPPPSRFGVAAEDGTEPDIDTPGLEGAAQILPAAAPPSEPLPDIGGGIADTQVRRAAAPPKPNLAAAPPPPPGVARAVSAPGAAAGGVTFERADEDAADLDVNSLLTYVVDSGASDLHLSVNAPPLARTSGDMKPVPGWPRLTDAQIYDATMGMLSDKQKALYRDNLELDFAYTLPDGSRFRGNLMRERGNVAAVFRAIPSTIVPLDNLGMPKVLYNLAALPRGLVLVTGPTGSGKSTTLAAMIDQINRTRQGHIITVEDPIEFVHQHRSCVLRQREVGADTKSFSAALKHVLRQDPDVILIGELRDLETISIALTAAETGHLVFATLHTQSAQDTVSRVIDVFPGGQQQQIRSQLAATLKGVVCQTLVKRADGQGRVPASEIMIVNAAIATQIRRDETHQIPQSLQSGAALGMHSLNQNLAELVHKKLIERAAAEEVATDLKDLANLIDGLQKRAPVGGAGVNPGQGGTGMSGILSGASL